MLIRFYKEKISPLAVKVLNLQKPAPYDHVKPMGAGPFKTLCIYKNLSLVAQAFNS
jgi:hypothetical protein